MLRLFSLGVSSTLEGPKMKFCVYLLSSVLPLFVLGCGGSMTTAPVAFTPPPTTNGQFGMTAVSTGPDTFLIGGQLQTNSSGSASGTFRVDSSTSTCFDFF